MRIQFNRQEEFLREVKVQAEKDEIHDRIARVCWWHEASGRFAGLYYVSLVVGFIGRQGYLYELIEPMGECWSGGARGTFEQENATKREARAGDLRNALRSLGFEVRGGRFLESGYE